MLYDVMILYPILEFIEDSELTVMDYGGTLTNAKAAALLRTTLNPDPVCWSPLWGKG